jgi:hypothetical protein
MFIETSVYFQRPTVPEVSIAATVRTSDATRLVGLEQAAGTEAALCTVANRIRQGSVAGGVIRLRAARSPDRRRGNLSCLPPLLEDSAGPRRDIRDV